jgi:hypothetical protein
MTTSASSESPCNEGSSTLNVSLRLWVPFASTG